MSSGNLKQKAASGVVWTALQKFSRILIQFISGIILARLLTPYDYGCIGLLSIFMVLAEVFIDGGFGSALIQKKRPTQEDYSTVFFWNIGMAVLMYVILFLSAPAISKFYNIPVLSNVLRVQGLVFFIYALNVVQRNQLKKQLNFKLLSLITIITSITSLAVTIIMAYKGFGVWALVTQNLVSATIPSIVFWFYVRWRPSPIFSVKSFKELFSFGFYMFLTHLINDFSSHIQGLLIGKLYSPVTMGYYSKAQGTEKLASRSISQIMTQVTYPLYAEVQDNKTILIQMIKRLMTTIAYITFPVMFILLLTAEPLFILLYSDRWVNSILYFRVLCIAGLAVCLQSVNLQAIAAIGKSRTMFLWTLLKRGLGVGFSVIGLFVWGMKGLLVGVVIHTWFSYFVNIGLVSKYIGYKWSRQMRDILPIFLVSIVSTLFSFVCGELLNLSLYLDGFVKAVLFITIYMVWSIVFKPDAYEYVVNMVSQKYHLGDRFKHSKK